MTKLYFFSLFLKLLYKGLAKGVLKIKWKRIRCFSLANTRD